MELIAPKNRLVTGGSFSLTPARQYWLAQLDRDATPLLTHLESRSTHRLGVYFEQLWHFFLQQDPDVELVAHNLAVHQEGRTLGEFDCLYYCHLRQRHVHLELAVKYFLAAPGSGEDTADASNWVGPDKRDRLDLKLDQLLSRQIRLGEQDAARQRLSDLGIDDPLLEIVFAGHLFEPEASPPPRPPGYNRQRTMNTWLMPEGLVAYCESINAQTFLVLPKRRWLSPARLRDTDESLAANQVTSAVNSHFAKQQYPVLLAALNDQGEESGRFFVVPDDWAD